MIKLIIDNTRRSGNFFDNINNYNMIVKEYEIKTTEDIKDIIKSNDNFIISDNSNDLSNIESISTLKYNYINEDTLSDFINPIYEKIFNKCRNTMFKLTKEQFTHYLDFCNKHKSCLRDTKTGLHKFGTIGGGISLIYKINYNAEELLPFVNFVKCYACETEKELNNNDEINLNIDDIDNLYNDYLKYYGNKFDKIEFYRFMEIYNEHKEPLIIKFMGTGLGNIITVQTKDYIYDITNVDCW